MQKSSLITANYSKYSLIKLQGTFVGIEQTFLSKTDT